MILTNVFSSELDDGRELKETMESQDKKEREVAQETLVSKVQSVSPVSK